PPSSNAPAGGVGRKKMKNATPCFSPRPRRKSEGDAVPSSRFFDAGIGGKNKSHESIVYDRRLTGKKP
ncbi:MAG: hypothetical protein IK066_11340, partial [Kiritimatiellae bacterium]|nr:hypothetical protein [Kiritimatiellia bacterium]